MKAMADAGAPFEAILIAVQALDAKDAEIARRENEAAEKRAKDAQRKREERAAAPSKKRPRTVRGRSKDCPMDPPIDIIHTPSPDISPDGESQERVSDTAKPDECDEVVSAWNAMAKITGLPACAKFSPARRKACRARLRDDGLQAIRAAIERVPRSAFLRGEVGEWAGASLDFLLRPDSVTKILEGKYDDRSNANRTTGQQGPDRRSSLARAIDEGLEWLDAR